MTWLRCLLLNIIFQLKYKKKATHFRADVYMNFFLDSDVKNSFFKFVKTF